MGRYRNHEGITIPITTVRVQAEEVGRRVGRRIIALVEGQQEVTEFECQAEILVRASTGPAPDKALSETAGRHRGRARRVFGCRNPRVVEVQCRLCAGTIERNSDGGFLFEARSRGLLLEDGRGAVAELVGIEGGAVSGVINLESSGVEASDWRPRHDDQYHEA
jgi:hypothetical protein